MEDIRMTHHSRMFPKVNLEETVSSSLIRMKSRGVLLSSEYGKAFCYVRSLF